MIGYVTIGAVDSVKSGKFYDALFAPLGHERKVASGNWIGYGKAGGGKTMMDCDTAICPPFDGKPARSGNGIMIAYAAASQQAVKAAYDAGMRSGGADEGPPGFRPPDATSGFFAAYLRDPTGNKLCVFCVV